MLSKTLLGSLKRLSSLLPLQRQAAVVTFLLPRKRWYRAALRLAAVQGRLVARMGGNGALTRALMLEHWLRLLTLRGPFPIPYRVTGLEVALAPGPKLYTWTHLPLTEAPLLAAVENGVEIPIVVSDLGKIVERDRFLVFGLAQRAEAVPVDAHLVRTVTRLLRQGKPVVFLSDPYLKGELSDVPLRLAARTHVPVVFQWAELQPDGVIEITFRSAPRPLIENEADLETNLAYLREGNSRTLARLGVPPSV